MTELLAEFGRLGIIADILGAILIAKGVFYRRNKDIFNTSGGFFGFSREKTLEAIIAKREALAGSLFLVIGFSMQYIGTYQKASDPRHDIDVLFASFCLLLGILVTIDIHLWSKRTVDSLVKKYDESKNDT